MAKVPAVASSILGVLALLLSAVGIYGTVPYQVSQRVHEIGVRIALSAEPLDVIRMVLRQGLRPVAWGTGIGLVGAFCFSVVLTILMPLPAMPDLTFGAGAFSITTFIGLELCSRWLCSWRASCRCGGLRNSSR
jgi:ABC-type antimicrobial peptide transport system permease subunit